MTRDEVLALAREVGLWEMLEGYSSEYGSLDAEEDCLPDLQRFAALVAAHEREACAYRAGIALLGADRGLANRVDQAIRSRT